jgi:glycosyltransferase involved in cell wall biosynthesis
MNILLLVDKFESAIDRLAQSIKRYNQHLNIEVVGVHPKRPSPEQIEEVAQKLDWCDFIMCNYWRSGEVVRQLYKDKWDSKPKTLHHNNPYDLDKMNWAEMYDAVAVNNSEQQTKIPYAFMIPIGIDLSFYTYNDNYTDEKVVNMVAGRIEGKKGVKEVAIACKELGYKFLLVGRPSDQNYLNEILGLGDFTIYKEDVTDEELRSLYYMSAIHVCNSVDGFESGTMPVLEAMACGVPVLTRSVGHIPDINNGANMIVRKGAVDDIEDLKKELKDLMENKALREKIRDAGWNTVKNRNAEKMARMQSNLIYKVLKEREKKPFVSVIIPTCNRQEQLSEVLPAIFNQTYPNVEVLVVDSSDKAISSASIELIRKNSKRPFKYIHFDRKGEYSLPKARNIGVMEAQGEYLLFCDDRFSMDENAVEEFMKMANEGDWLWGTKNKYEKSFVENFSFVKRSTVITYGMFNERIDRYGGATQEIRTRFERNGVFFVACNGANASEVKRVLGRNGRRKDIISSKFNLWKLYGEQ